jgi:hypothetical protein
VEREGRQEAEALSRSTQAQLAQLRASGRTRENYMMRHMRADEMCILAVLVADLSAALEKKNAEMERAWVHDGDEEAWEALQQQACTLLHVQFWFVSRC